MFCGHCGNKVPDGARYCPHCSNKMETENKMPVNKVDVAVNKYLLNVMQM